VEDIDRGFRMRGWGFRILGPKKKDTLLVTGILAELIAFFGINNVQNNTNSINT
jgi:hypothetical protein